MKVFTSSGIQEIGSSKPKPPATIYRTGRPLRDRAGRVAIQFGQFPDCEELSPDQTVSIIGWGDTLLASTPVKGEAGRLILAEIAEVIFGEVVLAHGEEPLEDFEFAQW
jgi:hypothetical protein